MVKALQHGIIQPDAILLYLTIVTSLNVTGQIHGPEIKAYYSITILQYWTVVHVTVSQCYGVTVSPVKSSNSIFRCSLFRDRDLSDIYNDVQ